MPEGPPAPPPPRSICSHCMECENSGANVASALSLTGQVFVNQTKPGKVSVPLAPSTGCQGGSSFPSGGRAPQLTRPPFTPGPWPVESFF